MRSILKYRIIFGDQERMEAPGLEERTNTNHGLPQSTNLSKPS